MKYSIAILLLTFLLWGCNKTSSIKDEKASYIENDLYLIQEVQKAFYHNDVLDSLIDYGLYNVAFDVVLQHSSEITDSNLIGYSTKFISNGEYDKGLFLLNFVRLNSFHYDVLLLKLSASLQKMDTSMSVILLDSLSQDPALVTNLEKRVEFNMCQAYHAHNKKDYVTSISIMEDCINQIVQNKLPLPLLAKAYRRIGNSFNDIVRDHIPFPLSKDSCYKLGVYYYNKELETIQSLQGNYHAVIALHYITKSMLYRSYYKTADSALIFYTQALKELIVSETDGYVVTRHPIYTSIALSQLGGLYRHIDALHAESYLKLNERIIEQRKLYQIGDAESLDILEYFPQRSQEVRIGALLTQESPSPIEILALSNETKYSKQHLNKGLSIVFGQAYNTAIKNWIQMHEIVAFADLTGFKVSEEFRERSKFYDESISVALQYKTKPINDLVASKLMEFCRESNSIIIDLQVMPGSYLLINYIDKDSIYFKILDHRNFISYKDVEQLVASINNNSISAFKSNSIEMCRKLNLNNVSQKNIIISPDEHLTEIPFDALITDLNTSQHWSELPYLIREHNIQIIPNLSAILPAEIRSQFSLNVLYSEDNNASLPFNNMLTDYLKKKFKVQLNGLEPSSILHIIAHTHIYNRSQTEFRLNTDTINSRKSKLYPTSLAVLHGCSSGKGQILKREGTISITRHFLYNQTPAVIFSNWEVDNFSSTQLFESFYSFLNQGFSSIESLSMSKRNILNNRKYIEWANPFYWANFQYIGKNLFFTNM